MPKRRLSGFTLIELMFVVAIIAIIASILIPILFIARLHANEAVTIKQMTAFAEKPPIIKLGVNEDGEPNDTAIFISHLATRLASDLNSSDDHTATRYGYVFKLFYPCSNDNAWRLYAWPEKYGESGELTCYADSNGMVLKTNNYLRKYSGIDKAPIRTAALTSAFELQRICDANNAFLGSDGQIWIIPSE